MKAVPTLQLSRIVQSPAATDFRGGKVSEVLSTVRRNNLAAEDAACLQSDLSLDAVVSTWTGSGTAKLPAQSIRSGDWNGTVHIPSASSPRKMEGMGIATLSHTAAACLVICRILQEN